MSIFAGRVISHISMSSVTLALLCATISAADAQVVDPAILETIEAVYAGISADEGEVRDWPVFYAHFTPNARLVSVSGNAAAGFAPQSLSVSEWTLANMSRLEGRGFVEDFQHYQIEAYGPIAQVFTSWTTRRARGGAGQSRGAATLQLVKTEEGWRVASWIWTGEQEGLALPGAPS